MENKKMQVAGTIIEVLIFICVLTIPVFLYVCTQKLDKADAFLTKQEKIQDAELAKLNIQ